MGEAQGDTLYRSLVDSLGDDAADIEPALNRILAQLGLKRETLRTEDLKRVALTYLLETHEDLAQGHEVISPSSLS